MRILTLTLCLGYGAPIWAQEAANPLIDYDGFAAAVREVGAARVTRRIDARRFLELAGQPGVVILDQAIRFAVQALTAAGTPLPGGWKVGNAKFLSPVGPGEVLLFTLDSKSSGAMAFTVRAGERNVASGSLTPLAE